MKIIIFVDEFSRIMLAGYNLVSTLANQEHFQFVSAPRSCAVMTMWRHVEMRISMSLIEQACVESVIYSFCRTCVTAAFIVFAHPSWRADAPAILGHWL